MNIKSTIAAGLVALSALAAAAPASAGSFSVTIGSGAPVYAQHYPDGAGWRGYRDRDYDRDRVRDHRRGDRLYGTLSPREVRQVLRDHGYREIQYLDRKGRVYEVRATNRRGHRIGLVVSARNGAILNAYRL